MRGHDIIVLEASVGGVEALSRLVAGLPPGLLAVRAAGGVAIVQDPAEATVAAMPRNANEIAGADHLRPRAEFVLTLPWRQS